MMKPKELHTQSDSPPSISVSPPSTGPRDEDRVNKNSLTWGGKGVNGCVRMLLSGKGRGKAGRGYPSDELDTPMQLAEIIMILLQIFPTQLVKVVLALVEVVAAQLVEVNGFDR